MGYQMPIFLMLTTIKIIVLEVFTSTIRPHALTAFPSFPPNRPISCRRFRDRRKRQPLQSSKS